MRKPTSRWPREEREVVSGICDAREERIEFLARKLHRSKAEVAKLIRF